MNNDFFKIASRLPLFQCTSELKSPLRRLFFYPQQHSEEMKEHLNQLNQRREYYEEIATERAIKEAEAEEAERIRVSVIIGVRFFWRINREGDTLRSAESDLWCGRSEEI